MGRSGTCRTLSSTQTRIPVQGSRDTLKALAGRFGKVLNIHGAMAHSPAVLETYAAIQEALLDTGTFDGETREAIALAVGNVDDCSYCQAAHTAGGRAAGLIEQETVDIRRGSVTDPKLGSLLALVREQAAHVGNVQDSTWQAALDAGWTDAELTETSAVVALNLFTNYFQPPRPDRARPAASASSVRTGLPNDGVVRAAS